MTTLLRTARAPEAVVATCQHGYEYTPGDSKYMVYGVKVGVGGDGKRK